MPAGRNGDRVRLLSKGGLDWTKRYSWIAERARKIRKSRFILDGEAVVLGVDGISDFNALHSRQHDEEVQLYVFDILAYDGDDLTRLPLHLRKTNLQQLLRGGRTTSSPPSSRKDWARPVRCRLSHGEGLVSTASDPTAPADAITG